MANERCSLDTTTSYKLEFINAMVDAFMGATFFANNQLFTSAKIRGVRADTKINVVERRGKLGTSEISLRNLPIPIMKFFVKKSRFDTFALLPNHSKLRIEFYTKHLSDAKLKIPTVLYP
ncbi:uncharacterized protein LOC130443053 [Diorhabda sublineata]|uniref:uncharacterized protein LOC130443053 n=1 Tax=Diorhabda sublineata TaxID=1163346 RepID=UPI0024E0B265|nr:uncharacterized protein LOC130443053 [Diorhabda sublineata]